MLRKVAGLLGGTASRGLAARFPQPCGEQLLGRQVTSSAPLLQAAAAAAATKTAHMQDVKIYRYNPDADGKPTMQTFKVHYPSFNHNQR